MDLDLTDRVVLVAGSSRGIGLATARRFLAEGARTVITGRDADALDVARLDLESEIEPGRILTHAGDLREPESVTALLRTIEDAWGPLDCLVANIGTGRGPIGWDAPESEWQRLLEDNLLVTYRLVQQVLPGMTQAGRGSIVMVASIVGLEGTDAPLPYSAAKAAVINYGKNLARLVGASSVRVNTVAPGNVLFPGGSWQRHLDERPESVNQMIESNVPLRRFGRPDEIADAIVFLSSDRASFITGACVVVDGGQSRTT